MKKIVLILATIILTSSIAGAESNQYITRRQAYEETVRQGLENLYTNGMANGRFLLTTTHISVNEKMYYIKGLQDFYMSIYAITDEGTATDEQEILLTFNRKDIHRILELNTHEIFKLLVKFYTSDRSQLDEPISISLLTHLLKKEPLK